MALRQKETKMQLKVLWNPRSSRSAKAPCRYTGVNKHKSHGEKRKERGMDRREKEMEEGRKKAGERGLLLFPF